jgi:hypothetical protein
MDPASIFYGDDEGPNEALVQVYLERIRRGQRLTMPILIRKADGRFRPLESDDASKIEAARRDGAGQIRAYVILDPGPELLEEFRRKMKALRLSRG